MKLKRLNLLLISILILSSCAQKNSIYWVNSSKVDCSGVGRMQCLQVQKSETINDNNWKNFHAPIKGFNFEPGYIYKLEVMEETLPADKVPADGSSIKYTLVKELEKFIDNKALISGEWLLNSINNGPINRTVILPTIQISLKEMTLSGSGGGNTYSGTIKEITQKSISFGTIASTKKTSFKKNIEKDYFIALEKVKAYQIEDEKLTFLGEQGEILLSFLKQKEQAANHNLHNIWITTRINEAPINRKNPIPTMEINLTEMKVFGSDGCNNYSGAIKKASDSELKFSPLVSTRKMCRNMEVPDAFNKAISKVSSYQLDGLKLTLLNEEGKEVLSFIKGD